MQSERPWDRYWPSYMPRNLDIKPKPLYSLVSETGAKDPGRACLSYQGSTLSYSFVDDASSRFASALVSLGLKRRDRVALFLPNIPQFTIAYFGALKAGGIVVPCSPLYKERELEHQISDSGASIVVAANDVVNGNDLFAPLQGCRSRLQLRAIIAASVTDYLPSFKRSLAGLAGVRNVRREGTVAFRDLTSKNAPLPAFEQVDPVGDVAVLQYTGGTTGISKGAMLSHANLYLNAAMTASALPLSERDVSLAVLPLFHIYGMTAVMNASLFAGCRIVLLPSFHVRQVLRALQKERVTVFCGVPTMYIAVINDPKVSRFNIRTVRACISGGAALPAAVRKKFMELTGGLLVEGYGLSEASPVTHCNPLEKGSVVKDGSIGIPFPSTQARIVDIDDPSKVLAYGEVGELAVKGPQVMLGYWNRKDETEMVLKGGWLLTGDIAKMDGDGYFFIVDRKKDMIDVGGFKVYPRDVEEVLFMHPAVKEAAVVGVPDEFRGESVNAYIVLKGESRGKVTPDEITDFCAKDLAKYKVPRTVLFVDELPKTLVGKVLRRKLREDATSARRP